MTFRHSSSGCASERDASLEDIINDALRRGLRDMAAPAKPQKPFRTMSVDLGTPLLPNIDNIGELLSIIEGDAHK